MEALPQSWRQYTALWGMVVLLYHQDLGMTSSDACIAAIKESCTVARECGTLAARNHCRPSRPCSKLSNLPYFGNRQRSHCVKLRCLFVSGMNSAWTCCFWTEESTSLSSVTIPSSSNFVNFTPWQGRTCSMHWRRSLQDLESQTLTALIMGNSSDHFTFHRFTKSWGTNHVTSSPYYSQNMLSRQ